MDEFKNEPFTDFSGTENAAAMTAALEKVRSELGREYPVIIGGEKIRLESKFKSFNPADKAEVVGVFSEVDSDTSLVDKAIETASRAFETWKHVPPTERAEYLFRAADLMPYIIVSLLEGAKIWSAWATKLMYASAKAYMSLGTSTRDSFIGTYSLGPM